jgi:hypothetical protein
MAVTCFKQPQVQWILKQISLATDAGYVVENKTPPDACQSELVAQEGLRR